MSDLEPDCGNDRKQNRKNNTVNDLSPFAAFLSAERHCRAGNGKEYVIYQHPRYSPELSAAAPSLDE